MDPRWRGLGTSPGVLWQPVLQTLHVRQVGGEDRGSPTCSLMPPVGLQTAWTWHPGLWSCAPRHPPQLGNRDEVPETGGAPPGTLPSPLYRPRQPDQRQRLTVAVQRQLPITSGDDDPSAGLSPHY